MVTDPSDAGAGGRRLDEVLAEYLQRVDAGELVNRDAFLAEHPELASEIAAFLDDGEAVGGLVKPLETVAYAKTPTRRESQGLRIRCPHCSSDVELLVDTPFAEITCSSCGSHFSLIDRDEATRFATPLKSIGRFELISRLGVGGFGSVWKARDTELQRIVAVKIPRKGQLAPDEIEQFFREARAAAQLRHPNIVPVHEVGRSDGTIFIVCDLVRGIDVNDWLTGHRPTFVQTAEVCRKIAAALHHAHQQGVIHRDLKPSNVMIDAEGEPHLMDFGLAKRETGDLTVTIEGQILGTPAYMSPEQAAGRSHWTDRRSDVYSLGVLLFRLLTDELPFRGNAQMQVHQRLTEDAPDPRKFNRRVPRDLATLCLKCLERDPNRRYATAQQTADEFDRFVKGIPIEARPVSRVARAARWARRKPALATAIGVISFLAIAGPLAALTINSDRQKLAERAAENDNLINRYRQDIEKHAAARAELQSRLDVWEGQANPWTFWPPRADHPPRKQLLATLHRRQFDSMDRQLRDGNYDAWQTACGRLALAGLAAEMARKDEAVEHLLKAEQSLRPLVEENPQVAAYRSALASCCEGLAEHLHDSQPSRAEGYLTEASAQYAKLIEQAVDVNQSRLARLRIELLAAQDKGGRGSEPHLAEVARLSDQIEQNLPTDPVELYKLVRHLSSEDPPQLPALEAADD